MKFSEEVVRLGLGSVPVLAAPFVLPQARRGEIARACERVRSALLRIATAHRWNPALPIPEGLSPLIDSESLTLERLAVCRLDALCEADGSGLKLLEIQAGDPSGAGWVDAIAGAMREEHAGLISHYEPLLPQRRALLLKAVPHQLPRVAVVNEDVSFVLSDTETMARLLRESGLDATRIDPRTFSWDGKHLTSGRKTFDVVLRDSHEELTLFRDQTDALWRALEAGFPRLNPFRDVWFDDKGCFALLWEARATLPEDERAAVETYVPRTVLVGPEHLEELRANRRQWVLKPAVGYGGFGIVVGEAVDQPEWEEALSAPGRTIAQHFVPVARCNVTRLEGGALAVRPQHVTVSFWCHGGVLSGGFARAGEHQVVNVHQGGGIGPLVFA